MKWGKPELVQQIGHFGKILALGFAFREHHVITCDQNGFVKLWELSSGRLVKTFSIPVEKLQKIKDVRISPMGKWVVFTIIQGGKVFKQQNFRFVYIFEVFTGTLIKFCKNFPLESLTFSPTEEYLNFELEKIEITYDLKNYKWLKGAGDGQLLKRDGVNKQRAKHI